MSEHPIDDVLPDAVAGYARRLHAAIGDVHHVASPLSAWLVLALAASAAHGSAAERLAEVLGMSTVDAGVAARRLLGDPHPAVSAAAAAWTGTGPDELTGPAADWVAGLPAPVARGPVPSQEEADRWARENTLGLIDRFPIGMNPPPLCVLAGALAARISWTVPFDIADAAEFRSAWRGPVGTVLRTPLHAHRCAVVRHDGAGDLAMHRAHANGMTVTSVIAAPDVPAARVLDAAHDAARGRVHRYSLFDLPLGDGPSWTIEESEGEDRQESLSAVLPAWSASAVHGLTDPRLGFGHAAAALARLFGTDLWEAKQAAVARYHRRGFEAAAVTALAMPTSYRVPRPGRQRQALLRFDRPYAVVAVATTHRPSVWDGLPVFSAWVRDPDDVSEE